MDFLIPAIAHAQSNPGVKSLVYRINDYVLNPLIKLGFVLALAWFLWGVVQYIRDRESGHIGQSSALGGADGPKSDSADKIVWGLVGLFIMSSAFAIMKFIAKTIGSDVI